MLQSQQPIIIALTKGCGTATFISDDGAIPPGCGTEVVTADINVHIPVQGRVDAKAETEKLEKKAALAQSNREKLNKVMGQVNYETTVKEEVRSGNADKVSVIRRRVVVELWLNERADGAGRWTRLKLRLRR